MQIDNSLKNLLGENVGVEVWLDENTFLCSIAGELQRDNSTGKWYISNNNNNEICFTEDMICYRYRNDIQIDISELKESK